MLCLLINTKAVGPKAFESSFLNGCSPSEDVELQTCPLSSSHAASVNKECIFMLLVSLVFVRFQKLHCLKQKQSLCDLELNS